MVSIGDSFLLPKPGQQVEHLWIVIIVPHPRTHDVIMVNLTTIRSHSDMTTILNPGDHPFVNRPSAIYYADARIADSRLLDRALNSGTATAHQVFNAALIAKIQSGINQSQFTPQKIITAFAGAVADGRV